MVQIHPQFRSAFNPDTTQGRMVLSIVLDNFSILFGVVIAGTLVFLNLSETSGRNYHSNGRTTLYQLYNTYLFPRFSRP
jgi:hypothetical protein